MSSDGSNFFCQHDFLLGNGENHGEAADFLDRHVIAVIVLQDLFLCLLQLLLRGLSCTGAFHFDNQPSARHLKGKVSPAAVLCRLAPDILAGTKTVKERRIACGVLAVRLMEAVQNLVGAVEQKRYVMVIHIRFVKHIR